MMTSFFFFNYPATPEIYTLSLHDALPISTTVRAAVVDGRTPLPIKLDVEEPLTVGADGILNTRSEEHTSELQSLTELVCRLLLEKKKYSRHAQPIQNTSLTCWATTAPAKQ